ncbi:conserved Plasmodium protein, unknown function [Plasmodium malariae]|uniref:Uncharacterized protein n=1 Tax=Plasmodium malariae TaxID=5858 RepID=A0A1A8WCI3_PLAMA|nr:conserved Plasmodium protein, unknown function [Plasmodium malariae]SBS89724.1 hypothetical protein, conserved [Plasmodium malariae]SCP02786.1 conserved Plasmodium protein, unknown function [Plasmodium malariae]
MGNTIYSESVTSSYSRKCYGERRNKNGNKDEESSNTEKKGGESSNNENKNGKSSNNQKKDESNCDSKKPRKKNEPKLRTSGKLSKSSINENVELFKTKNRVKRYKPSKCLLRNSIFCVNYKIDDTFFPLLMELKNEPQCKIVLVDDHGNIIKEILIKDIETIESSINTIDIFLRINKEYTEQQKFNLCSFILKDNDDKISFIHNIKMLYGLNVLEYGTVKYNKINTEEIEEKYVYDNNILNKENKNNFQNLLDDINNKLYKNTQQFEKNIERKKMDEIINTALKLGHVYNPIIILGDMQDGDIIKVKELNSMQTDNSKKKENISHDDFTLIEWFLSKKIGSNNNFREESIHCGNNFLLKSFMVGYFIKVKVSKNIYINNRKTFVTSISTKGPVTINDTTAKQILKYISNVNECIQIYLSSSDIYNIFFSYTEPKINIIGLFIFYPANIFIMRKGLRFAITLNEQSYSVDYLWNSFYLTKKDILFDKPSDFIPTYMDMADIHLYFITSTLNGDKVKSILRTNSSNERNIIYATVFFYKYQKRIESIDEFMRDSLAGSYNNLKKKFQNIFLDLKGDDIKQIDLANA